MAPNPYVKALAPGSAAAAGGSSAAASKRKERRKSASTGTTAADSPVKGKGKARADDSALRAEILALGGAEDDLDLLDGVDSESEVEGDEPAGAAKGDAGLLKDLRSFVKGLDFSAAGASALADEDEEVEGATDDEENDEAAPEEVQDEPVEPVAPEPVVEEVKEKKESKVEREARRKLEREAAKEAERQEKEERVVAKLEKRVAKLEGGKSPWIIDPTPHWYAVPTVTPSPTATRPKPELVTSMLARGQALLQKENDLYSSSLDPKASKHGAPPPPNGLAKSDQVFIQQILSSGTSSDRISALLLLISSSPLHTTSYLEQLAALTRKKSRDESLKAMRGLVDWFRGEGGGSPSRKLRYFADQPTLPTVAAAYEALEKKGKKAVDEFEGLTNEDVERCLVLFAYEDWFKRWFFQILQALEQMSVDPLPHPRTQAVMHLSNLLRDKPEQEGNILRLLVNKLGDTNRSIASKTSHHLLQTVQSHPGMTPMLVREVSALVLRPRSTLPAAPAASSFGHVRFGGDDEADKKKKKKAPAPNATPKDSARDNARYYGVTTLNQIMLKKEQGEVAGKMVDVYFEVFSDVLGRLPDKDEDEGADSSAGEEDKPKGKKRARGGDKGAKKGKQEPPQDAVNEVDSKLIAAVLTGINRAFPFAKLDDEAFQRRLDTLFRITHTSTFNVSIQALLLIYHVSSAKREVSDRFYRALYASLHDPRLVHSSKQALYLNLVFRATKQDKDVNRVAAFVKRLIQILGTMETTFVLGALYIVGELLATVTGLRTLLTVPEKTKLATVAEASKAAGADADERATDRYDGRKREPRFAHAENSCLWELTPLLTHYHPTVASYASSLLAGDSLSAASDLEQYSLAAFLDRFVYREGKKTATSRGASMMQSGLAGQDQSGRVTLVKGGAKARGEGAVNSDQFRRRNVHDVPVDQVFFHKFFTSKAALEGTKAASASKRKARRGGGSDDDDDELAGSDAESIADAAGDADGVGFDEDQLAAAMSEQEDDEDDEETDEELEREIWREMKRTMPREKGDSDLDLGDDDDDEDGDEDADMDDAGDLAQYDYTDSEEEGQDEPFVSAFPDEDAQEGEGDDDGFLEEDDDVFASDEDLPLAGGDSSDDDGEAAPAGKKANKKRKLKHLPTFASAEDYAHLLGGADDDDDDDDEDV
ncbi:RNA-binding ribosome biosynthesis protein MAK21 [Rhodotorula paludigena]|uniref:RNA-binding ribosome biosynthesis protein MAK21 n=1 Tax=Rhodotorula paludigena TaxID=86838 RepID=UPI00317547DA